MADADEPSDATQGDMLMAAKARRQASRKTAAASFFAATPSDGGVLLPQSVFPAANFSSIPQPLPVVPLREQLMPLLGKVIDLFRQMDTNGDGKIAKVEFGKAVRRLNLEPSPSRAEIDSLFDECDLDGSGTVEYKELQRLVRRRAPTSSEPSALQMMSASRAHAHPAPSTAQPNYAQLNAAQPTCHVPPTPPVPMCGSGSFATFGQPSPAPPAQPAPTALPASACGCGAGSLSSYAQPPAPPASACSDGGFSSYARAPPAPHTPLTRQDSLPAPALGCGAFSNQESRYQAQQPTYASSGAGGLYPLPGGAGGQSGRY